MQRSDKSVLGSLELAQPRPCPAFWTGCDVNGRVDKSLTAPRASSPVFHSLYSQGRMLGLCCCEGSWPSWYAAPTVGSGRLQSAAAAVDAATRP